ncbi:aminoglycoside phosphotransferase family protein [Pseudooctadecabacter sp.]|uniref:aminoglycoside phosphotransferase family protein n=1 Tax=Pseudooctadecabacter sp. TaxID=1966338 RepID=UPI0025DB5736|nr:phosphotransferase [Pseudooctadecabacter sp.]
MRDSQITDWLSGHGWSGWTRNPIAGDASARRYERLSGPDGDTVILMDAPPETCGSQAAFVTVARHLRSLGLAAPDVLAEDLEVGVLILSDLGQADFATHLAVRPDDEGVLYGAAVDVLRRLSDHPAPDGLPVMTPTTGAQMLAPAFDWAFTEASPDLKADIMDQMTQLLASVDPQPVTLSLRDFHAENLIWRGGLTGVDRVGLLDFQDAFVTHPTYDLASLLRDARRDVSDDLLKDLLRRLDPSGDARDLRRAFHIMAVQRNLRILGIFHRLAKVDGKTRYLDFVPRVTAHLHADLAHPALADIRPLILRFLLKDTS